MGRGRNQANRDLTAYAYKVLEGIQPCTLRHLHYVIFSRHEIPYDNTVADYERLMRQVRDARRKYRDWELAGYPEPGLGIDEAIPPEWIKDETREPERISTWADVWDYAGWAKRQHRKDKWATQGVHLEIWCEKTTILGEVREVAEEYDLTIRTIHGWSGPGMEQATGREFAEIVKPIQILYIGDHDYAGEGIARQVHVEVARASGRSIAFEKVAVLASDIKRFGLPPNKLKKMKAGKDATPESIAVLHKRQKTIEESWEHDYGKDAPTVEVDAMPDGAIAERLREHIGIVLDREAWDKGLAEEENERNRIEHEIGGIQW